MKKIMWFTFLCCIMAGQPVGAQIKESEQQKSKYDNGNRDPEFLRGYIKALETDGQIEVLERVVDEYLMKLRLDERYFGENLLYFMKYVTHMNTKTFVDVIENWDKLSLTQEQSDKIVDKIDNVCKTDLFQMVMDELEKKGEPHVDCSAVQVALKKSNIPVSNVRRQVIEMWQYRQAKDITGMIQAFADMLLKLETFSGDKDNGVPNLDMMFDGVIIGDMVNYILEECNLNQCIQMFDIMNQVVEKNNSSTFMEMITKWKNNFEGKKMMMEMGEE